MAPSGAKTFGAEFPGAGTRLTGLFEWFASHLSVRRKSHFEFRARGRCGCERLPSKEGCLYVVWRHRLRS